MDIHILALINKQISKNVQFIFILNLHQSSMLKYVHVSLASAIYTGNIVFYCGTNRTEEPLELFYKICIQEKLYLKKNEQSLDSQKYIEIELFIF